MPQKIAQDLRSCGVSAFESSNLSPCTKSDELVKISVIIPALNEEKYILNSLEGLKKQSFKDFEVIVSDGGSSDRTREIARKYARVIIDSKGRHTRIPRCGHEALKRPAQDILQCI
jgi:cellulose synthase/poly-beta-1,6-N-acetylglucosamine synthase-like glycosyltransferase